MMAEKIKILGNFDWLLKIKFLGNFDWLLRILGKRISFLRSFWLHFLQVIYIYINLRSMQK